MTPEHPLPTQNVRADVRGRSGVEAEHVLYRAFVDAAPQFIALAGLDGRVLYVNPGGRRLAGIPDDVDVTATTIADYLTDEGLAASLEVEQPAVRRDGRYEGETTLRHWPTGEGIPVRVASFLVTDPATGAPMALATVQSDLREVVAARAAMQRQVANQRGLLLHLHEAQEAERQRIAGEIHDDTVQVMAALNLRLQTLRRSLEPLLPPDRAADLAALEESVREGTSRLRRLLMELDPPPTTGEDVEEALRAIVRSTFGARTTRGPGRRPGDEPAVTRRRSGADADRPRGPGERRQARRREPGHGRAAGGARGVPAEGARRRARHRRRAGQQPPAPRPARHARAGRLGRR